MNQIQHDTIKTYLDNDEQAFKDLKHYFNNISDLEKKLDSAYDGLRICLKDIREQKEKIPKVASFIEQLEQSIKLVSDSKKTYIQLLDTKVMPSLNGQLEQNKQKKTILLDYTTKLTIEKQKEEKRQQNNKDQTKNKELYEAVEIAKRDKEETAKAFITQYTIYVNEKNAELKAMFQHLLNSLLIISACSLQEFSKTAHFIHQTDEKRDTEIFLAQMLGNQRNK